MKITNCGKGIHQREIPGIEKLKELPDSWHAFTNLDLALPGKGPREIDLIMVIDDSLIMVDLKDWIGPITSQEGNWFNGKNDLGRSPVRKIAENVRELAPLLKKFLTDQARKEKGLTNQLAVPWIEGVVVLTRTSDRTGIAVSEVARVFSIDHFIKMLRNRDLRNEQLEHRSRSEDFTSPEWIARFRRFFNTSSGIFKAGTRRYGGYKASLNSDKPTFRHRDGIFTEFDVEEEGIKTSAGLLRRWDFTAAETRFQTEEGRAIIAGRERAVISWLDDRNPKCGEAVLKPKVDDPDRGVTYWEVFERRRRMLRLENFRSIELPTLTPRERVELARQVLSKMASIHNLQAAHLDIGTHSVWLELPTTVRLSHLMAATIPSLETLGESRFQFLSSSTVPEDILGGSSDPIRKDVFLLGCVVHTLLFGEQPTGEPPEWNEAIDPDGKFSEYHPWFERCLELDQNKRFSSASEMLDAFNAAVSLVPNGKQTRDGLDRFKSLKSQRQIYQAYPETQFIHEDDRVIVWRSDTREACRLVKLWKSAEIGDIAKEGPRILAFLEKAHSIAESPISGIGSVIDVHWTEDSIVLVNKFVEGRTLSELMAESRIVADCEATIKFLNALIDVVDGLHDRSLAHGDLKPANIVVTSSNVGDMRPVLIDVLDYSSAREGERLSRAYAPASGGRFERDRFAVTKIAEEMLEPHARYLSSWDDLKQAINDCRVVPPVNGTLLPLHEALERAQRPAPVISEGTTYKVSILGSAIGPILSDEGLYWVSRRGSQFLIRGATEQLVVVLDDAGKLDRAYRRELSQGDIQRARRHEYASFCGSIVVVDGVVHGLSSLADLLQSFGEPPTASVSGKEIGALDSESRGTDIEASAIEAEQDRISEQIAEESISSVKVDVPRLWRRGVDIESDLRTEVAVLGDSTFRPATQRHVAPIQLMIGSFDYDRDDTVQVEKQDAKRGWIRIGTLDLQASTSEFIAIASRVDSSRGALVQDGNRLRFQSKFENTSRERRQEATSRILRGGAAVPMLIDVFNPSAGTFPRRLECEINEEAIAKKYGLNSIQISGFKNALECRPVALLQGPPGTGKTLFIAALVHYALTNGLAKNVLLTSQSHEAVNNAAEKVLELFGDDRDSLSLIRVGNEGAVSEELLPYHVARVEKAYKDRFIATAKSRFEVIAAALGLDKDICDSVLYFEETVRPVIARIVDYTRDDVDLAKINELARTVEAMLDARGVIVDLSEIEPELLESNLADAYLSSLHSTKSAYIEKLRQVIQLGRDFTGSVSTRQRSFETFLAGTRQVVAGTCVGLGRGSLGLTKTTFDLVVVDEAARCTPSELAVPIQSGKWIVLVGDHAQLEPLHPGDIVDALAGELGLPLHEVQRSDFERVFESDYGKAAGSTLTKQYRMLPPIGRVVSSAFYNGGLLHGRTNSIIDEGILPPELQVPLQWVSTDSAGSGGYQKRDLKQGQSLFNPLEVDAILSLLKRCAEHEPFIEWLLGRSDSGHPIGIICAYALQRDYLWKKLQAENLPDVLRRAIKVDTIDSYQGKENLIVLLSLVRNNADGIVDGGEKTIAPGFMARKNRINVALSRAMDRLVIVGARMRWRSGSPMALVSDAFSEEVKAGEARVVDAQELIESSASSVRLKKTGKKTLASGVIEDRA
jgi:serine/threonine protein kinase